MVDLKGERETIRRRLAAARGRIRKDRNTVKTCLLALKVYDTIEKTRRK